LPGRKKPVLSLSWGQALAYRLSKHHLDRRARKEDLTRVVADICAVHAQLFSAAELAVWARIYEVHQGDLKDYLWKKRTLVKNWGMRGTLHLFPADEYWTYVRVLAKTRTGYRTGAWQRGEGVTLEEIERIIVLVGSALGRGSLTREELADIVSRKVGPHLRNLMLSGWGSLLKPAAYNGSLVFAPPRDGKTAFLRPDRWLKTRPKKEDYDVSVKTILSRYLGAYGPATHADFAQWWGISSASGRRLFESIGEEITQVDVEGYRAWMLGVDVDKIRKASTVNCVRLLPNFDSYVMGFRPRDLLVPKNHLCLVFRPQAWVSPVILVDGRAAGTWELQKGKTNKLHARLFTRLSEVQKSELKEEVDRLGGFLERRLTVEISI